MPRCGETPGEAGSGETLPEGRGERELGQALPEHMTMAWPMCARAPQDGRPPSGLDISPDSPRPATGPDSFPGFLTHLNGRLVLAKVLPLFR